MRPEGVEPSSPFGRQGLSLLRLPVSPQAHIASHSEIPPTLHTGSRTRIVVFRTSKWGCRDSNPNLQFGRLTCLAVKHYILVPHQGLAPGAGIEPAMAVGAGYDPATLDSKSNVLPITPADYTFVRRGN